MSGLLALMLAAGTARIETVGVATVQSRPALQLRWSGALGKVTVERAGDVATVSFEGAALGAMFAGASRFEWSWASLAAEAAGAAPAQSVRIEEEATGVTITVRLASGAAVETRRGEGRLVLIFVPPRADVPPAPAQLAAAVPPAPEPVVPASPPVIVAATAVAPPPPAPPVAPPASDPTIESPGAGPSEGIRVASLDAERLSRLFPIAAAEAPQQAAANPAAASTPPAELDGGGDVYKKLFPSSPGEGLLAAGEGLPSSTEGHPTGEPTQALSVGPVRLRPYLTVGYIRADVTVQGPQPVSDSYFQFQPGLAFETSVRQGRLTLDYQPTFRALGSFDAVQGTSQQMSASLGLPLGPAVKVDITDHFATGVLETAEVDPGHEYFFDLGHFNRNLLGFGAQFELGSKMSIDIGANANRVRFDEPAGFFDYDSRMARAGLGFEISPNLRAVASYVYDWVPTPAERPQAEMHAQSGQVTLSGDLLPTLHGQLSLGYRDQSSPNAGEGGQSFKGLTLSGSLLRELGRSSSVGLTLNRSTPVSSFEDNAFYVSNSVLATFTTPLPYSFALDGGAGYLWNNYQTPALALGQPREDRVFGFFVGLRRPVTRWATLSASYRRDQRSSNLDEFDSLVQGLILQLDVNFFSGHR